ncbi:reverse transcriptase domain-containing protein [Evansella tamaricis]|uniref:RNA-directed DNA polymerase n=1 Tax=Evansella tamaricis TaxID=2069301 RepID=A0ABS6JKN2_9BACI|nr:reverse transcriptase domain-containing protein [Evansella tamaricis]MBU9714108.1 trypsin-like peptidase domain-containing protein [Evansella tamaricis]
MNVELTKPDTLLIYEFQNLHSFSDIANLLEIPIEVLWKNVVDKKKYHSLKIPKKQSDKFRIINKPSKNLNIIQKKFNYILSLVYKSSHSTSHGFEKHKSIRTNAICHLNRQLVLNLDLEEFFSSIIFPRVRAMFMTYFKFNNEVATTLANICCDNNNKLPQGAATSPIVSNIIAYKLDKQLSRLARTNGCIYSRYADDITLSTNNKKFRFEIFNGNDGVKEVGEKVKQIIQSNGFKINSSKTRICENSKAQYVTGVKVNSKLNVNRTYVRRIRSILHTIEKNLDNIEEAVKIFKEKYPYRATLFNNYDMFNIVRGMISHIGHIKGKQDAVFQKFVIRYNRIISEINTKEGTNYAFLYRPYTWTEFRQQNIYVIEEDEISYRLGSLNKKIISSQGSAFLLQGIGLVTNWHVVKCFIEGVINNELATFNSNYYIPVTKSRYSDKIWFAKIIMFDKGRDIAVLKIDGVDEKLYGFDYSLDIKENMECCLLGYPEYIRDQTLHEVEGKIQSQRISRYYPNDYVRYTTTMAIHGGNSGGPVVNKENNVIAIAVKGSNNTVAEVIPIGDLLESINQQQMIKIEQHNIVQTTEVSKS